MRESEHHLWNGLHTSGPREALDGWPGSLLDREPMGDLDFIWKRSKRTEKLCVDDISRVGNILYVFIADLWVMLSVGIHSPIRLFELNVHISQLSFQSGVSTFKLLNFVLQAGTTLLQFVRRFTLLRNTWVHRTRLNINRTRKHGVRQVLPLEHVVDRFAGWSNVVWNCSSKKEIEIRMYW